jgi:hypothetical protein
MQSPDVIASLSNKASIIDKNMVVTYSYVDRN